MNLFKKNTKLRPQKGFTMVELLFAVANFAFIMMIAISAFIAVMQVYNKTNFARQTQQTARSAVDQIARDAQYTSSMFTGTAGYPCTTTSTGPINVDCVCFLKPDKGMVAYYTAYTSSTSSPSTTPASPGDNINLWRAQVDPGNAETLLAGGLYNGCQSLVIGNLISNWNSAGITTSNLIPKNMNVSQFIILPDSDSDRYRYNMTILGLSKGTQTSVSDPFFDNFQINSITAIRKEI